MNLDLAPADASANANRLRQGISGDESPHRTLAKAENLGYPLDIYEVIALDDHLHVRMCFNGPKYSVRSYRDGERIYCCVDIDKDFNRHSPQRMKDKLKGFWDMCHQMLDDWANQGYPVPHDHLVIKIYGKEIRSLSDVVKAQATVEVARLKGLAAKNEMSVREYLARAETFRQTLEEMFEKELPWQHLSSDR